MQRTLKKHVRTVACGLTAVPASLTLTASPALGSRGQLAMFQDDVQLLSQPETTLDTFRQLGVGVVRIAVQWSRIAPSASSSHRPAGLGASNPASYPAANWSIYDT